jgi:hypothetical protein
LSAGCLVRRILQGTIQEMLMLTNQMSSSMEQVCVNDHGYSKRFMRSLQVADVINILEDLFHMSQNNPEIGPMEHLQASAHPSFLFKYLFRSLSFC